jgi:hypothetical protein
MHSTRGDKNKTFLSRKRASEVFHLSAYANKLATHPNKKPLLQAGKVFLIVPGTGFEPAHLAAPPPEDGASTNFATRASFRGSKYRRFYGLKTDSLETCYLVW